jgi:hypothetical protein
VRDQAALHFKALGVLMPLRMQVVGPEKGQEILARLRNIFENQAFLCEL